MIVETENRMLNEAGYDLYSPKCILLVHVLSLNTEIQMLSLNHNSSAGISMFNPQVIPHSDCLRFSF